MSLYKQFPSEYQSWSAMKQRCTNRNSSSWKNYGGRGITFSPRWKRFQYFLADMGPKPSSEHSLDRIDNNGPYSKENCRWATSKEQANNTYRNRLLTSGGITKTWSEWADSSELPRHMVLNRLMDGWSVEQACTIPKGGRREVRESREPTATRDKRRYTLAQREKAIKRWREAGYSETRIRRTLSELYPLR